MFSFKLLILISTISYSYCQLKLVCYWPNWVSTPVEDIDPTLCTHIHYSFASLDEKSLTIKLKQPNREAQLINRLRNLKTKNSNVKIILSLGGWGDLSKKYSKMVSQESSRKKFVQEAIALLKKHHFDGLDLDWEFPVCWEANCQAGPAADKSNFAKLLKELRSAFDQQKPKILLSAAVNGGQHIADRAYNYSILGRTLDYINIMTYDNAGVWDNKAGHHAGFNWAKNTLTRWMEKGIQKAKLLMGVPFYGQQFTLANPNNTKIGAPIKKNSKTVFVPYLEICKNVKFNHWTKKFIESEGPISYKANNWVGYDDSKRVKQKAEWIRTNGFGGVLVWEVTLDDVKANCCSTNRPLLRAVNYGLFQKGADPSSYKCE